MPARETQRRWRQIGKATLIVIIAIASVPFIIVAMFGAAGGKR